MALKLAAEDWMEEAESAERGEAWPQALAIWKRTAGICEGDKLNRCRVGIARCEHEIAADVELASVAKRMLKIPTLETQNSDSLDFHEVAVWQIREALRLVHRMGRKSGQE